MRCICETDDLSFGIGKVLLSFAAALCRFCLADFPFAERLRAELMTSDVCRMGGALGS